MRTKPIRAGVDWFTLALALLASCVATAVAGDAKTAAGDTMRAAEAWAFPVAKSPDPSAPHASAPKQDPREPMHVPGSMRSYTSGEMGSPFFAADWFPKDHPPAPRVVLHGRKPAWACGMCHYPDGAGDTGSATLAGLPKAYILEQVKAFRAGQRRPADPVMGQEARNLADADLQQAADYFSRLKLPPIRHVVETASVPKAHWADYALAPDRDGAREPIGERIIEMPNDRTLYELGDERTGFVDYVPPGSIARGAIIASMGKGAAAACESCHGAGLQGQNTPGIGIAPPLAGRSATYIVRELILFRTGRRTNPEAAPMRAEAAQLTLPEMIAVAAYAASRAP